MTSRKDELLERIDSDTLLRLAESVSESPIRSGTTRAQLLRIVKESLSIEEIRRKARPMRGDLKSRELTRNELTSGGIGQVFLAVSGMMSIFVWYPPHTVYTGADFYQFIAVWDLVRNIFLLIFAILLAVSVLKIAGKMGRNNVGTAAWVFALITTITGLTFSILTILGVTLEQEYFGYDYSAPNLLYEILTFSCVILLGVTLTLLGVFFLMYRDYSPSGDLWMAGGIVYVFTGASQLNPISSLYTISSLYAISSLYVGTSLFVAAIIGATCFLLRKATE